MADQYVDLNLGNDGNAGTSWGAGNAVASVGQGLTNASAGDHVYVRSYGPDDPYIITAELIPNGEIIEGRVGADSGTDPGDYAYAWITTVTADVDIFSGTNTFTCRYIVADNDGTPAGATNFGWYISGTTDVTLEHCRVECSTDKGVYSAKTGGTVTLREFEAYGTAAGEDHIYFAGSGCTVVIDHYISDGAGTYGIRLINTLDTDAVTMRHCLIANAGTAPVYVGAVADFAPGSPDFNAFDTASGVTTYANAQPSPVPANDVYGITPADHLPALDYGVLRLSRESSLVGAGWPNGHRREDIGIDGEYVEVVEAEWSGYERNGATEGGDPDDWFGHNANHDRAQIKFYLGTAIAPSDIVAHAWLFVHVENVTTDTVTIAAYGDDGYTYDPEQDSLAERHSRSLGGVQIYTGATVFTGAGDVEIYFDDAAVVNTALGKGRRFSIGLVTAESNTDTCGISAYDNTTVAERPRLILIYAPAHLEYRDGLTGWLANKVRQYAMRT